MLFLWNRTLYCADGHPHSFSMIGFCCTVYGSVEDEVYAKLAAKLSACILVVNLNFWKLSSLVNRETENAMFQAAFTHRLIIQGYALTAQMIKPWKSWNAFFASTKIFFLCLLLQIHHFWCSCKSDVYLVLMNFSTFTVLCWWYACCGHCCVQHCYLLSTDTL